MFLAAASLAGSHRRLFLRSLDQVRCQRAQRPQLTADQRQLCLHQTLYLIDFVRHLFQFGRQGFLGVALDLDGGLVRQSRGDLLDAGGQGCSDTIDQVVADFCR